MKLNVLPIVCFRCVSVLIV